MIAKRVKRNQIGATLAEGLRDLVFIGGGCAIVWGVQFLSVPGAWIVGGVLAMYLAYATAGSDESIEVESMEIQS